ncbi:MAG: HAD-IIIC family phosphatase [Clostridia bacterium]|nr:HAD-IIIC family phosphatase [Clostridia bacterium]
MSKTDFPFDFDALTAHRKRTRRELLADGTKRIKKNIAVLGGSTTNDFIKTLEIFLLSEGIEPSFYESEYNRFWQDAMFENAELKEFAPDIIYIHTSYRNIAKFLPSVEENEHEVQARLEERFSYYEKMWKKLASEYSCPIIQNNFELPHYRLFGNRDSFDVHGGVRFINKLNQYFADYARENQGFFVSDINYVSSCFGLDKWYDEQAWYMYKYACSLEAVPHVAYNLSHIIKSIFGKNKKLLALDLDNTLWGGVVGDDGVEGIEIGEETATAECYKAFQEYVKKLKSIGIMLSVASKNDHENAIAGLNHPDGVLRPEDFIVIKANWETKDRNLAATAAEMDLGVDSFVFADDNPTERALVERSIKGIAVPVMDNPAEYIKTIDRNGYFEVTSFSADDLKRNDMYKANVKRAELSTEFTDYTEYLLSLDMKAEIKPFSSVYMQRITQLTNKSNQFNLTTKRYTQPEIESAASDGEHITLYGKLSDTFGDNGVVSVVIGKINDNVCDIELWLMSCRVLKKNMEYAMLDTLVSECKARGIDTIIGHYYPTAKNGMVKNLFGDFGFEKVSIDENGNIEWKLSLEGYENKNSVIKVNTEE